MKKIISLFLAVLMIFTAFSTVLAYAEGTPGEIYTIRFFDENGELLATREVEYYGIVKAPENPSKADEINENGETVIYTFEGWNDGNSETIYHASTIPVATKDVDYTAKYSSTVKGESQSLMAFIRSLFARINIIFEYFYRIFNRKTNG